MDSDELKLINGKTIIVKINGGIEKFNFQELNLKIISDRISFQNYGIFKIYCWLFKISGKIFISIITSIYMIL